MKRILPLAISLALMLAICSEASGQLKLSSAGNDLEGMFRRIREILPPEKKLMINDSIRFLVEKYTRSDSVFVHKFNNLRYLGQITSPDSLLKIITWNLVLENGDNRYFCYFIHKGSMGHDNDVYKLSGKYSELPVRSDTIYSGSDWYGALYYDLRPFKNGNETSYILLGIDYGNSFITRKIIDVLSFGQNNSLIFGRRCFMDGKVLKPRVVFEYSSSVMMSLRFSGEHAIVFDHLSPSSPEYRDNHQFWGPDFTFDSYNLENGIWKLNTNVDVRMKKGKS